MAERIGPPTGGALGTLHAEGERAPAPSSRCPTCYARAASERLGDDRAAGVGVETRCGRALGMLDHLADAARGWRFCAEHAPADCASLRPEPVLVSAEDLEAIRQACKKACEEPRPIVAIMQGQLTALDRADMRRELEIRAEDCAMRADDAALCDRTEAAASWRARALRIRQLIALLAVLLVCACNEWPLGAPPHGVCFDGSVPADDRAVWRAAEQRWNVEIGTAVLLDETAGCDVRVRASTELGEPACTLPVDDHVRIFYVPALLRPCVALHELAHVLLGPGGHMPGTVFAEYGCDHSDVLAPVAERVKAKWGLP